jgi:1,5-anhydro-D-fructose reductase (1,5-anhydro-D-mannitol-forming)
MAIGSNGKPLGWGLIGASTVARQYMVAAINAQPNGRVVAIASSDPVRGQRFATEHGIPRAYQSVDALLADRQVDAVYVSTTNERHHDQALASAAAGKHVLCESPLALSLADARAMVAACRAAGVVLGTNLRLRNAVTHRALRRLLAEGVIGEPLQARVFHAYSLPPELRHGWRLHRSEAGGGVILDVTVHDADTLRFVLDDECVEVTAIGVGQGMASHGLEDAVMGVLRFARGTLVLIHDAYNIEHALTGLEILGTAGSLIAENAMTQEPQGRAFLLKDRVWEEMETEIPESLYERSVRLFTDAVFGRGQPAATGEDGVASLAVALAVQESARSGRRVAVSLPQ